MNRNTDAANIWCVIIVIAGLCLAQLLVPQRHEAEAAESQQCECTCLPPGDYDAALFCKGAVNVRLRPAMPSELNEKLSEVD